MLSRLVITFLLRGKHRLFISWLQSPSAVILEPQKIKSDTFHCFSIYLPWSDGTRCHDLCFLSIELNVVLWIPRLSYRNNNPLQYFCLENPTDRGAWLAIVDRVVKSGTGLRDWTETQHTRNSSSEVKHQGNNHTSTLIHQGSISYQRGSSSCKGESLFCLLFFYLGQVLFF